MCELYFFKHEVNLMIPSYTDVRKPLYVVGAGDLGTDAHILDNQLTRIFDLAATWEAIVLIDEADVFLEERSFHDISRNAMVAVFLRQLEYVTEHILRCARTARLKYAHCACSLSAEHTILGKCGSGPRTRTPKPLKRPRPLIFNCKID